MNVQKRRKAKTTKTSRTSRSRKTKKQQKDLVETLKGIATTAFVWALVIVNLFLIASFITGKISTNQTDRRASSVSESYRDEEPPAPAPAASQKIEVEVLNGCNAKGLAGRITEYLRIKGFDVVYYGNYYTYNIEKTVVINRRPENQEFAIEVAKALGVDLQTSVFSVMSDEKDLDVSVILGRDYNKLNGIGKPNK